MSGTTAGSNPILSLSQVEGWLNLEGDEVPDIVDAAVQAASDAVIDWLCWDPRINPYTELLDGNGATTLPVSYAPITAVTAVASVYPGCPPVPFDLTQVSWHPTHALIYSSAGFGSGDANIQVSYTAGLATLPNSILQGVRYTIKSMLDGSGVDFSATGESYAGVLTQNWQPGGPATVPIAAQTLMRRYQRKF